MASTQCIIQCSECGEKRYGDQKKTRLWMKLHHKMTHADMTLDIAVQKSDHKSNTKHGQYRKEFQTEFNMTSLDKLA